MLQAAQKKLTTQTIKAETIVSESIKYSNSGIGIDKSVTAKTINRTCRIYLNIKKPVMRCSIYNRIKRAVNSMKK